MGLDNIINRFRADFVCGVISYLGFPGLQPTPEELVHGKLFAGRDNVIASFISSSYYESFMQVLEALFMPLSRKIDCGSGTPNPWESFVALLFTFERTALTHSSRTVYGT